MLTVQCPFGCWIWVLLRVTRESRAISGSSLYTCRRNPWEEQSDLLGKIEQELSRIKMTSVGKHFETTDQVRMRMQMQRTKIIIHPFRKLTPIPIAPKMLLRAQNPRLFSYAWIISGPYVGITRSKLSLWRWRGSKRITSHSLYGRYQEAL